MQLPPNTFKSALAQGRQQLGFWCTLASPIATEVAAGAGFDWLLFDTEHSPSDLETVLALLQAASGYAVSAVVRPAVNDPVLIKRFLDIGVQSLLIPNVQSADEARAAVAAVRYPPEGIRGVSALTRASRFGRVENYLRQAERELCLLVQVESETALGEIEAIAEVEGVDGIFVGPADLAASLGHLGQLGHPVVREAVEDAIKRIVAAGKPAGVLTTDRSFAKHCIGLGTTFTAVGIDVAVLAWETDALFRSLAGD